MSIAQRIENEWDHLTDRLRQQAESSASSQQEVPHMTVSARLIDAEKAVKALASHIEAFAANPLVDALVELGAGIFLTPAEVAAVKVFVQALENGRKPAENAVTAGEGVVQAFGSSGQAADGEPVAQPAQIM